MLEHVTFYKFFEILNSKIVMYVHVFNILATLMCSGELLWLQEMLWTPIHAYRVHFERPGAHEIAMTHIPQEVQNWAKLIIFCTFWSVFWHFFSKKRSLRAYNQRLSIGDGIGGTLISWGDAFGNNPDMPCAFWEIWSSQKCHNENPIGCPK